MRIHGTVYPDELSAPRKAARPSTGARSPWQWTGDSTDPELTEPRMESETEDEKSIVSTTCRIIRKFLWAESSDDDPLGPIPAEWLLGTKEEETSFSLRAVIVELEDNSPADRGAPEEHMKQTDQALSTGRQQERSSRYTDKDKRERHTHTVKAKGKQPMEGERPERDKHPTKDDHPAGENLKQT